MYISKRWQRGCSEASRQSFCGLRLHLASHAVLQEPCRGSRSSLAGIGRTMSHLLWNWGAAQHNLKHEKQSSVCKRSSVSASSMLQNFATFSQKSWTVWWFPWAPLCSLHLHRQHFWCRLYAFVMHCIAALYSVFPRHKEDKKLKTAYMSGQRTARFNMPASETYQSHFPNLASKQLWQTCWKRR